MSKWVLEIGRTRMVAGFVEVELLTTMEEASRETKKREFTFSSSPVDSLFIFMIFTDSPTATSRSVSLSF